MSKRPRNRPSTPDQVLSAMKERRAREAEIDRLQAQGVEVVAAPNKEIIRAMRMDVFSLLLRREAISLTGFDAFRRLEEAHAVATGALKQEQGYDRVDTTTIGQNVTDAMIDASATIDAVLGLVGPVSSRLLRALLEPRAALAGQWHHTVERITGETADKAKAALIRQACVNLSEAWKAHDYRRAA